MADEQNLWQMRGITAASQSQVNGEAAAKEAKTLAKITLSFMFGRNSVEPCTAADHHDSNIYSLAKSKNKSVVSRFPASKSNESKRGASWRPNKASS